MCCSRKQADEKQTSRIVHVADATHLEHSSFEGNFTRTTKYTWYSYLPKSLFEQVRPPYLKSLEQRSKKA